MKKTLAIIAAILSCCSLYAQTGPWSGKISISGVSLTLIFNLDDDNCTMDSPDQGAKGIKAVKTITPEGKVIITVPAIGASFEGFCLMNSLVGEFIQGGYSFPLTLKPGVPKLNRPQTPVGPFPYSTQEVSFSNADAVLQGTLTVPQGCNRDTPVVLLVTGSGLQNRDEELFEHKPFAVIADALARAGIATLRYDDRGFGASKGDAVNCTTEDLKNDALSGIAMLRERFGKVGVAGHSEGGTIAFMLAARKEVDFVISLAGAVISMAETLVQQNEDALSKMGFPEEVTKEYCTALSNAFDAVAKGETPCDIDATQLPDALKQNFKGVLQQIATPYMKYFLSLDVSKLLPDVDCPVLALNGTMDSQVDCKANLGTLRNGLNPQKSSVVEVDGVNHLFQHCKTGDVSEYKEIEETFAPEVLEQIILWIRSNIHN